MKGSLFKIWGIGFIMVLLVSLFFSVAPASADTYAWSAEAIPSIGDKVLGPAGIDIRDIAVAADGKTIYATPADSLIDNIIYKTTDTGLIWSDISISVQADLVAVAPDDANVVAIANSSTPAVYLSTDGGSNWHSLGTPQQSGGAAASALYDIAISAESSGIRYIAVAGKEAGDVANVWYFESGSPAPVWQETNNLTDFSSANLVRTIAFSPNFSSDKLMVAVSEKDNVSIALQILSFGSERWNAGAGFSGYPATIVADDGITDLTSASISLAPGYQGDDASKRVAFVGLTVEGDAAAKATSGIYRLNDNTKKALETSVNIHSIDYNGSTLVAGAYDSTDVYRSSDPLVATPTVSNALSLKRPGGVNKTVVAWAGSNVVTGTSGNESAFAVSGNNGEAFNDIALIDTVITNARNVAVSPDGSKVYLVTDDGNDLSLWRRTSSWERVLSKQGTANYIVRLSPEDSDVVYLAKSGDETIYHSRDGGKGEWFTRICRIRVQDLAVESNDIIYALSVEGEVSRSTNAGSTWGIAKSTELDSGTGHMIASVSQNNLLVGSTNGYVAYSTDGNLSWTKISKVLEEGAGKVQVIPDDGFATNRTIYAASDVARQNIKKWKIGSSTDWTDIFRDTLAGGIYGLAMDGGVLYALEFNSATGQSALWICLTPASATMWSESWSSKATTATTDVDDATVHLNAAPQALKVSSVGKLWAVKTNGTNKLYSFTTILTELVVRAPSRGATYTVNAATGVADEIVFSWERLSTATEYELDIALDQDFNALVTTITIKSDETMVAMPVGPRREGDARASLMPGTTYYWRVRVTQPLYSLYSETRSFTIMPAQALVPELLAPENGSMGISRTPSFSWKPVSGAAEYRFVLADNVDLVSPIADVIVETSGFAVSRELDYGKTYYWVIKPVTPVEGRWSALANFTIKEAPVAPVPPVVVEQAPPLIITLPEPPPQPPKIVISPPLPMPLPITPPYIWAMIIIGVALVVAVILLISRTFGVPVVRVYELKKVGGAIVNYFKPTGTVTPTSGEKEEGLKELQEARPVLIAAESFLWMTTSGENGESMLSADQEQALGQTVASRIQKIAEEYLLYREFPEDAAMLFSIWAQYGSRDETNRYLTQSFQSGASHVIEFLNCYLSPSRGGELDSPQSGDFTRAQYDSIARVVDTDSVLAALSRLYGSQLDTLEGEGENGSPDKLIAHQFARIHRQTNSEMKIGDKEKALY